MHDRDISSRLKGFWAKQPLSRQFLATSAAVFLSGMIITGAWIARRVEAGVTQNTATATALYFESFVAPLVQSLAVQDNLPADEKASLSRVISDTPLGRRVISFKIWRKGNSIAFATNPALIDKAFPPSAKLTQAWTGHVAASFDDLNEEENRDERSSGVPLLEIYVPIRAENSEHIIAVAEFYEIAKTLKQDIFRAKLEAWLIVGGIAAVAVAILFGMVGRASRTIERQIAQLRSLLAQNQDLRIRVERSSQRATEVNERYLRRLGGELHDGPAQLIGLALLRLDTLDRRAALAGETSRTKPSPDNVDTIRTALSDALSEIRNISAGMSLPELHRLSIADTLRAAVKDHIRRTGTAVTTDIVCDVQYTAAQAIKIAAFRLVQESLNNATRHAGAKGQTVLGRRDGALLVIEVRDAGPGFDAADPPEDGKLELVGMRQRVEGIGGWFSLQSSAVGTCVTAKLPLNYGEP